MRYVIYGGRPIRGSVRVGPAKNALLPELAATLLADDEVRLSPITSMRDVQAMVDLLRGTGAAVRCVPGVGQGAVAVRAMGRLCPDPAAEVVARMRASVLVMGPLLVRCGRVRLATPGGCAIGDRPIDLHLRAMEALGAQVREGAGFVEVTASRGLIGGHVHLPFPSHTATENAMMAAVMARGQTVISGAAREPEIVDLALLLGRMGADITGAGGRVIRIQGRASLHGTTHRPVGDRIEAGTYLLAAASTGGDIRVDGVCPDHLGALLRKLSASGLQVGTQGEAIHLAPASPGTAPRAVDVRTQPYPGFPTDLQPQFCVLAAVSRGGSLVHETIFNHRLSHLNELRRMGASIIKYGTRFAWIDGPAALRGSRVTAADLRGGAALVLAGMAASGETVVEAAEHVARGYTDLPTTLRALGAAVQAETGGDAAPGTTRPSAVTVGVGIPL